MRSMDTLKECVCDLCLDLRSQVDKTTKLLKRASAPGLDGRRSAPLTNPDIFELLRQPYEQFCDYWNDCCNGDPPTMADWIRDLVHEEVAREGGVG